MNTTDATRIPITAPDALPAEAHFTFALDQRVMHAVYGAGTIRGCLSAHGTLQWTVEFDTPPDPTAPPNVPMLYAVTEDTLTPFA